MNNSKVKSFIFLVLAGLLVGPLQAQPGANVEILVAPTPKIKLYAGVEGRGWNPISDFYSEPGHSLHPMWIQGPQLGIGIRGKRKSELIFELNWLRIRNYQANRQDSLGTGAWDAKEREVWIRISRRWPLFAVGDKLEGSIKLGGIFGYSSLVNEPQESNRFEQEWDEVFVEAFLEPALQFKIFNRTHLHLSAPLYFAKISLGSQRTSNPGIPINQQSSTTQSFLVNIKAGLRLGLSVEL